MTGTIGHSVDSGFSLRSQHADRIRWPSRLRYQQQRSVSDLELAYKSKGAPPPLPQAPPPPRTTDLEYLDNPAETLEFAKKRILTPKGRLDDEYYRHLTARNHQEKHWQRLPPLPAIPPVPNAAPGLRRSRSLAVIREEANSAPLIPRARLADKPAYKERVTLRSKYQSKEDIEQIYSKSTNSCYGAISDDQRHKEESTFTSRGEAIYEDTRKLIHTANINGWVPSSLEHKKKLIHHSDEVVLSRNPSEIDSLDSNYVQKNYNFEAHQSNTYKETSSDSTENSTDYRAKPLYVRAETYREKEETDNYYSNGSPRNLPFNCSNKCTIERSKSLDDGLCSFDVSEPRIKETNGNLLVTDKKLQPSNDPEHSDDESCHSLGTSTPTDKDNVSETSYITISPLSTNNSLGRLENLAASLADKIDEYCESKYSENFIEKPSNLQSAGNNYNSKSFDDLKSIYTKVNKIKPKNSLSDSKLGYTSTENQSQKNNVQEQYLHKQCVKTSDKLKTRSLYRQSSSAKNITTEPFVYTLIENQYYSLPDINVSKSLRRSERIDAQLRQQDRCNSYIKRLDVTYNTEPLSIQTEVSEEDESRLNEISIIEIEDVQRNEYDTVQEYRNILITEELDSKFEPNYDTILSDEEYTTIPPIHTLHKKEKQLIQENHNCIDTYETKAVTLASSLSCNSSTKNIASFAQLTDTENEDLAPNKDFNSKTFVKEKSFERNKSEETELYERIDLVEIGKKRSKVTKHYSLRQREPTSHEDFVLPNPPTEYFSRVKENQKPRPQLKRPIQRYNSFNGRDLNYPNLNKDGGKSITILPLSGHQTIIIEPQNKNSNTRSTENNESFEEKDNEVKYDIITHFDSLRKLQQTTSQREEDKNSRGQNKQIPRVKRERSLKIAEVQNKFEKPPNRLIIKDKKILSKSFTEMSRPQILSITDSKRNSTTTNQTNNKVDKAIRNADLIAHNKQESCENVSKNVFSVTEKVDRVVKTDIEYQEKLHSVKNYWSKLIDSRMSNENICDEDFKNKEINMEDVTPESDNQSMSIENIIKSIETVKIVDSIKKKANENDDNECWKQRGSMENVKCESISEESPAVINLSDSSISSENVYDTVNEINDSKHVSLSTDISIDTTDYKSLSPDIEIVEIESDDPAKNGKHATLIKTKSLNEENCSEFDHIRYKIMKSDLFRKRIIANTKKEAQFDGLIQYLQDYSFQELLVNNNIVIIEPVRTKIEIPNSRNNNINCSNRSKVTGSTAKQTENKTNGAETSKQRKSALRKHFFYHPIRVNKEIIEEELPDPDTVKTVRNIFEGTLRMRRPGDSSDPCLVNDSSTEMPKRVMHHKNLSIDSKLDSTNRKIAKYLTIDTSFGHKKWDSVSLSSGVSSGDLSSNNEHDYDTDALSPFQNKHNTEQIYTSSSEEYLCESLNANLCYESQYVSQDILQKIRECGTSITYYGGKVLDEKSGPAVSPMTKAIMDEIRGLQRNCCRDCTVCQTKCTDTKCVCLANFGDSNKADHRTQLNLYKHCPCTENDDKHYKTDMEQGNAINDNGRNDNYLGFKFKLVKSNSCSSRLELAGTGDEHQDNVQSGARKSIDDPPIIYDNENSVKTKIFRIESYRKGIVSSPFSDSQGETPSCNMIALTSVENNLTTLVNKNDNENLNSEKDVEGAYSNIGLPIKITPYSAKDKKCTNNGEQKKVAEARTNDNLVITEENVPSVTEVIRTINDPKKHYYINTENIDCKKHGKFGEMEFEEFQILDSNHERKCNKGTSEDRNK